MSINYSQNLKNITVVRNGGNLVSYGQYVHKATRFDVLKCF